MVLDRYEMSDSCWRHLLSGTRINTYIQCCENPNSSAGPMTGGLNKRLSRMALTR